MADFQDPNDRDAASENDIVAAAFASYRASAPKNFTPPPATALMAKASGGRSRKRALTVSIAAIACTGLMAAGVAVAQTVVDPGGSGLGAKDHGQHSASAGKGGKGSHGGDHSKDPSSSLPDLRSMAITLPAFTGREDACPAGTYRFPPDDSSDSSGMPSGSPDDMSSDSGKPNSDHGDWSLLPGGSKPVYSDVDGDGAQDAVVPVACGDTPGVVALSETSKAFDSIGFVYTADKPGPVITVVKANHGTVTLDIDPTLTDRRGPQTFVYRDGQFVPGDGDNPSTDPTDPGTTDPSSPGDDDSSSKPGGGASTSANGEPAPRLMSTVE